MSSTPSVVLSTTTVPVSTADSIPSPLPECNPFVTYNMHFSDVGRPYCAYNSNISIPYLSSCCAPGAEVKMWFDCIQYCDVSDEQFESWKECVVEVFPEADQEGHVFPCFNEMAEAGGPEGTRAPGLAQSVRPVPTAGSEDDAVDTASIDRPSLTLVGCMVAFLAVGAGLMA